MKHVSIKSCAENESFDLVELYFQHQIEVIRATFSQDARARDVHLSKAEYFARNIEGIQRELGASAANMWDRHI